jgi:hypothetical protein
MATIAANVALSPVATVFLPGSASHSGTITVADLAAMMNAAEAVKAAPKAQRGPKCRTCSAQLAAWRYMICARCFLDDVREPPAPPRRAQIADHLTDPDEVRKQIAAVRYWACKNLHRIGPAAIVSPYMDMAPVGLAGRSGRQVSQVSVVLAEMADTDVEWFLYRAGFDVKAAADNVCVHIQHIIMPHILATRPPLPHGLQMPGERLREWRV